jgi:hypothetical protein|tara:strand:- start:518 stop:703 length:186 start_codon:yes stop_codon:yes gene_type:complete
MKLRTKDEIITCLIKSLSVDLSEEDYIHEGWIEALKWVLTLDDAKEEIFNDGLNTLVVKEK